jgi:hypothetical protein
MFRIVLTILALVALISTAEARPHHHRAFAAKPTSCFLFGCLTHATVAAKVGASRPAGCPHAWCGCWLAAHLGLSDRSLWLAANWVRLGRSAGGPQAGAVAVWRHHVGLIREVSGNQILLLSGNDGHAVRERWRPTRGIIAYRVI